MHFLERKTVAVVVLFIISFGSYSSSLQNDFVWDDTEVITKSSASFKRADISSLLLPKETKNKNARYWRPVLQATYLADMNIWGVKPMGFHLSNLLMNCAAVIALYFMSLLMFRDFGASYYKRAAFLGALLFALHPMHVESVSWIAGRTDVLATLFFLIGFALHIRLSSAASPVGGASLLLLAAACFYLALLSKEVAVAFPLVVVFYDLLTKRVNRVRTVPVYVVYACLTALYLYLRGKGFVNIPDELPASAAEALNQTPATTAAGVKYWGEFTTLVSAYYFYVYKLVVPFEFNAYITTVTKDTYYLVSSAIVIGGISAVGIYAFIKRANTAAFSIFWTLATLGPSALLAVFPLAATPLSERYLYLPSVGVCIAVAGLIGYVGEKTGSRRVFLYSAFIISSLFFSYTLSRQLAWKDNLSLWADTVQKSPLSAAAHVNYGYALQEKGRLEEAVREYLFALSPNIKDTERGRAKASINIGNLFLGVGNLSKAEDYFLKAYEFDPRYGRANYHMGLINYIKGIEYGSESHFHEAKRFFIKTIKTYKNFPKAHLMLAKVYMELGNDKGALKQVQAAIKGGLAGELKNEAEEIRKMYDRSGQDEP